MDLPTFAEHLQQYVEQVRKAGHHDARRNAFFGFVQQAFSIGLQEWEVEAKVYRGWVDAVLGRLVFEFKTDLVREMGDAESELRRYLGQLHQRDRSATFTAVVTDGLRFVLYSPEFSQTEVLLEKLSELNLAAVDVLRSESVSDCYYRLDALLAPFHRDTVSPTVQNVVLTLGAGSTAFRIALSELHRLYETAKAEPAVVVRFRQWNRLLGIVLGEGPNDADLFLRHTFLATVDKLVAYRVLEPKRALTTDTELAEVVSGKAFAELGISNFIEEDFFTWFLVEPVHDMGVSFLRRLGGTLQRYDFSQVSQDVLKELYQEIVERAARHDIGEYYTPDWLAEVVLRESLKLAAQPEASVLDPACGSGTFLFMAIRVVKKELQARGWPKSRVLAHILDAIQGVDVHPVAVITARTNYLVALGDMVEGERSPVSIPVYLADAVLPPELQTLEQAAPRRGRRRGLGVGRLETEAVLPWPSGESGVTFEYPGSVLVHPQVMDSFVGAMRGGLDYLDTRGRDVKYIAGAKEGYTAEVKALARKASLTVSDEAMRYLGNMFQQVAEFYVEGKDTVWLFLLKNMPRPAFLRQRQFDFVVGNPPWLSLRHFRGPGYAARIKKLALDDYNLRPRNQTHLATQMELATLFFVRAVDHYLKPHGTIAFVMPRSVLVASQHARFNDFVFYARGGSLMVRVKEILDLENVSPLFNVPSCVVVAEKGQETEWPVPGERFSGSLDGRNVSWSEAQSRLQRQRVKLRRVEGKILPIQEAEALQESLGRSPYADDFGQGATIVPRVFWFVRQAESRFGFLADAPLVETDEEAVRQSKEPWRQLRLKGPVEAQFLYATILSGDLLPFGFTCLSQVVSPILPQGARYKLLDSEAARVQGFPHLAHWLGNVQGHWEQQSRRDEKNLLKIERAVQRLDYRRGLTSQRPDVRWKVLYGRSGTNLVAAVIDLQTLKEDAQPDIAKYRGFVVDSTNHYAEIDDSSEAHYLAAVLNSATLDRLIKPLQTRGLWGERDIYQLAWRMPVPKFDKRNSVHCQLAELSQVCHSKIRKVASDIGQRYRSPARQRAMARVSLRNELAAVDGLVKTLLTHEGK